MKVKANLTNQTLECLDNKPYIQGYDTRNRLIVYVDSSITLTSIQIAYQLQNGRTTIKYSNNGMVAATLDDDTTPNPDYIAGYNGYIFNAFSNGQAMQIAQSAGNFVATVIFNFDGNTYKINVLNTVLKSADFEAFEYALIGTTADINAFMQTTTEDITELQQKVEELETGGLTPSEADERYLKRTDTITNAQIDALFE